MLGANALSGAGTVAKPMLTHVGDVLILQTKRSYTIYAVGLVTREGQQDFGGASTAITHVTDRSAAVARAKTLLARGRRILLWDVDTGDWSDISN
jgi:hypothetical protein